MVAAGFGAVDADQGVADGGGHEFTVTAQENLTTCRHKLPHPIARGPQRVLDIAVRVPAKLAEREVQRRHAGRLPAFHFGPAQPVMVGVARAEEQVARSRGPLRGTFGKETTQWGKAGSRTDQ